MLEDSRISMVSNMYSHRKSLEKLKLVSSAKLKIWEKYLKYWLSFTDGETLFIVDLYAGSGKYEDEQIGTPLIAAKAAYQAAQKGKKIALILTEKNRRKAHLLQEHIVQTFPDLPKLVSLFIFATEAENISYFVSLIIGNSPSLILLDPYGYPLPIEQIQKLLENRNAEILINLMWFRINMDIFQNKQKSPIRRFWGENFKSEFVKPLRDVEKRNRDSAFLARIARRFRSKFHIPFQVCYSPEDVHGKLQTRRTKYFLVHFSNKLSSALAMRDIMWSVGDSPGAFSYTGRYDAIIHKENIADMENRLREKLMWILLFLFGGQEISLGDFLARTISWRCPTEILLYSLKKLRDTGLVLAKGKIARNTTNTRIRFAYAFAHENRLDGDILESHNWLQKGQ